MSLVTFNNRYAALLDAGLGNDEVERELKSLEANLTASEKAQFQRLVSFGRNLGVPMAELLRDSAVRLEQRIEQSRQLESAFAGPKSTAYLVAGLPVLSLAMAQLSGLNPLEALATNGLAQLSFCLGLLLLITGWLVMTRMLARARPANQDPAELLGFFAQSLLSGLPTQECLEASCLQVGIGSNPVTDAVKVDRTLQSQFVECLRLLDYSQSSGSSLRKLLLAEASARRSEHFAQQRAAIEKLAVRLMIPLGLVVLPAFVLIGILPVTVGMLSGH